MLTNKGEIIAAPNGSPLVIGINKNNKSIFLSSDVVSFGNYVDKTVFIDNQQIVMVKNHTFSIKSIETHENIFPVYKKHLIGNITTNKGKFKHYMIKEIFDTPSALEVLTKI